MKKCTALILAIFLIFSNIAITASDSLYSEPIQVEHIQLIESPIVEEETSAPVESPEETPVVEIELPPEEETIKTTKVVYKKVIQSNPVVSSQGLSPLGAFIPETESVAAGDYEVIGTDGVFTYEDGVLYINEGTAVIKNIETVAVSSTPIIVRGNAHITLAGINTQVESGAALKINPDVTVTINLSDNVTNVLRGGNNFAALEVSWDNQDLYSDLTIEGTGTLEAYGGANSAGIGGSKGNKGLYGNITINSGIIHATGNAGGAGIGSSDNPNNGKSSGSYKHTDQNWGTITINNGTIYAYGGNTGNGGAGIGGGNHVDSGLIIINDGYIEAYGGAPGGAGIGNSIGSSKDRGNAGDKGPGYYFVTVEINGGTIRAYGGNYNAAGIGGGMYSDADIHINGGDIVATGGAGNNNWHHGAAGIGGGYEAHANVVITGGYINAAGGGTAAGIGSGGSPNGKAERGNTGRGAAAHLNRTSVTITNGEIIATGGAKGGAGIGSSDGADRVAIDISGGTIYAYGAKSSEAEMKGGAGIGSAYNAINESGEFKYIVETDTKIEISGGKIYSVGGWGAAGIGSGALNQRAAITITSGDIEAHADGTKFAIDTRPDSDSNEYKSQTYPQHITTQIVQGTFVRDSKYSYAGTHDVQVQSQYNVLRSTNLVEGYRSFALTVPVKDEYNIYAKKHFTAESYLDVHEGSNVLTNITFVNNNGAMSDNFYLYPVEDAPVTPTPTPSPTPEPTAIIARKLWDDNKDADKIRPNSITLLLYANDVLVDTKVVTAGENEKWEYEFLNLPTVTKDGTPIKYTLKEEPVEGYTQDHLGYNLVNIHPTFTPSPTPTPTPTPTPPITPTPTEVPTDEPTPTIPSTPIPTPTETATERITERPTETPSPTPTVRPKPTAPATRNPPAPDIPSVTPTIPPDVIEVIERPEVPEALLPTKRPGKYLMEIIEDYDTPLGVDIMINHVGDCFD